MQNKEKYSMFNNQYSILNYQIDHLNIEHWLLIIEY